MDDAGQTSLEHMVVLMVIMLLGALLTAVAAGLVGSKQGAQELISNYSSQAGKVLMQ